MELPRFRSPLHISARYRSGVVSSCPLARFCATIGKHTNVANALRSNSTRRASAMLMPQWQQESKFPPDQSVPSFTHTCEGKYRNLASFLKLLFKAKVFSINVR